MGAITSRSFDEPDEQRTPDKTEVSVVDLGGAKAARMRLAPGWKWSECIKPVVGTANCQTRHVGVGVSGSLHLVHEDGTEVDVNAGDAYVIEPGHDAWVTSAEPFVCYEFESTTAGTYATPS